MTYILDLILPNFHFLTSTKLLACSYADKFLSLKPIAQLSALELIGITALSLASKFNEGKNLTPAVVFQILDSKFSIDSIVKMETFFLLTLDWKLAHETPCNFINEIIEYTISDTSCGKIADTAHIFAAMCYIDSNISCEGGYMIAIASISMALDRMKFADFKNEWLLNIESKAAFNRKKLEKIEEMISKKYFQSHE